MEQARDVYNQKGYFAAITHLLGIGVNLHKAESIVNQMRQEAIEKKEEVVHEEFEVV